LVEYVTKITSDKKERAAKVLEAVVYYPTPFCQLISSSSIDNIVFVVNRMDDLVGMDPDFVYEDFLEYVKNRIQTNVINKLKERKSGDDVIAKAHRILDNINVCGISARLALTNDPKKRKEGRFEEF
jgi:hypothetical protein